MTRTPRLTIGRIESIGRQLSARDGLIVGTVAKLRYATTIQLERVHFIDGTPSSNSRRARLALRRLRELGVLARLDRQVGGARSGSEGIVHCLGPAGQYLAHRQDNIRRRRPSEPGSPFVTHHLQVSELFVNLTEASRRGELELIGFDAEPAAWRAFFGPGGARVVLKPDAFIRTATPGSAYEQLFFAEVDRSSESSTVLATTFRRYRQHWATDREQAQWGGTYPRVVWLVPSERRLRQVIDVAASQPPESWKLFTVRLYPEALSVFAGEVQS